MAFQLYETQNPIDREQRRRINLNWNMISDRFSNMQGQISVLAGGEDVEALITRINQSIINADEATRLATEATAIANEAIVNVNSSREATEAATTAANEATAAAQIANQTVQLQIDELNEKLPELNKQLEDNTTLRNELTTLQSELTTLQGELNTAKENTEKATEDAIAAYNQIKGWGAATVWSNAVPYEKNNVVTHNGSSWQAVNPNVNSQPSASNPDWLVLARAGLDGLGSVITVNNQSPDMEGNVQITKTDIELGNVENYTIATTDEAIEGTTDEAYMTPLRTKQAIDVNLKQITDELAIKDVEMVDGDNIVQTKIKSPVNVKRIDGKTIVNLAPLFDSGAWVGINGTSIIAIRSNSLHITANAGDFVYVDIHNVQVGKSYYLDGDVNQHAELSFEFFNANNDMISHGIVGETFTVPANTVKVRIIARTKTTGQIAIFSSISLVEGTQAQPFVANVKGLTNPTIVNETNGTSLVVPTTLYDGEYVEQNAKGELVKYKKWHEEFLEGFSFTLSSSTKPGVRTVFARGSASGIKSRDTLHLVKYNGAIVKTLIDGDGEEATWGASLKDGIYITIPNTDSGWGQNYTPTPEEIKAYFLGWQMSSTATATPTPYNGTGTKYWRALSVKPEGTTQYTTTLPTTKAPGTGSAGTWQPYRLIHELETPVQEVIQPYSDLTLEKGENNVKVYAGRIVNEFNKPYRFKTGTYDRYEINTIADGLNPLKFNASKMLNVYENGKISNDWLYELTAEGYVRALRNAYLHDPTASYTVDYEPLYTWEVTAPIDSVQLQYFETLQAVANELVYDVAKQQDTVKRMLENVVNEEEGLVWINTTLLNGWLANNPVQYTKDKTGTVFLRGRITSGTTTDGTAVFYLPKGYIPKQSLFYKQRGADVYVENIGRVTIYGFSGTYFVIDGISFKAEL